MVTVLVIDDTETDRQLAAQVVKGLGYQVLFAGDGVEGVGKAKDIKPDLILLDVVMPKQDGFATCRELKKDADTKDIPVVLTTSKGTDTDKFWGQRQGASAYVVKPYGPAELRDVLTNLVK
ncbi:MAG: PleD family two-component system response regulator [Planctomycetota bacterium]